MSIHSFHARQDHHRSATTWQMLLESAATEHDVVHIARDFIASFTPHEVELMPLECRPCKLVDGEDLASYSYDLATHRGDVDDAGAAVMQAFTRFFADASERLARVSGTGADTQRESA
jgi:hypothetical protein